MNNIFDKTKILILMGLRNLWRQKKRSAIVISAAAVGMVGIIFGAGFMNGMFNMMTGSAIESGMGHVQIRPKNFLKERKAGMILKNDEQIRAFLSRLEKENSSLSKNAISFQYAFRLEREGIIRLNSQLQGVVINGIDPQKEKEISRFDEWLIKGEYLKPAKEKKENVSDSAEGGSIRPIPILIGEVNARKMEIDVGDYLILSFGDKDGNAVSLRANVTGIFKSIAEPIDKFTVLMRKTDLSHYYLRESNKDISSYVAILSSSMEKTAVLKKMIWDKMIEEKSKMLETSELASYSDLEPGIARMIDMSNSMMSVFYIILLFGFALTLMNTILMSVMERTREIGIMMALGSRSGVIFWMIIAESMLLSFIGTLIGTGIGGLIIVWQSVTGISLAAFSEGMELMAKSGTMIYPSIGVSDIVTGMTIAMVMSFLASVYPSRKATRMVPVKAIYGR